MAGENPTRRLTLRQLITHAEKNSRSVIEHLHNEVLAQLSDFRDLTRPVRRRSHFPTMLALQNALKKLLEANQEVSALATELHAQMKDIRDRAKKESVNRF